MEKEEEKSERFDINSNLKYQLTVQRRSLSMKGLINLEGLQISSLHGFGVQPHLKILNISNTPIRSFEELPPEPWLAQIVANGSNLDTLAGLSRHSRLKDIQFTETPLALKPDIRISCLIVIGPQLSVINKVPVKKNERQEAARYPVIARSLLESGWQLEVPVPSCEQFKRLAKEHNVLKPLVDSLDQQKRRGELSSYFKPPNVLIDPQSDDELQQQQLAMSMTNEEEEKEEELSEQARLDTELEERLSKTLAQIGIRVKQDQNCRKEIIEAITGLTDLVKIFDNCTDEIIKEEEEEEEYEQGGAQV